MSERKASSSSSTLALSSPKGGTGPGLYFVVLNSLWWLRGFRERFVGYHDKATGRCKWAHHHVPGRDCVFCALKALFRHCHMNTEKLEVWRGNEIVAQQRLSLRGNGFLEYLKDGFDATRLDSKQGVMLGRHIWAELTGNLDLDAPHRTILKMYVCDTTELNAANASHVSRAGGEAGGGEGKGEGGGGGRDGGYEDEDKQHRQQQHQHRQQVPQRFQASRGGEGEGKNGRDPRRDMSNLCR